MCVCLLSEIAIGRACVRACQEIATPAAMVNGGKEEVTKREKSLFVAVFCLSMVKIVVRPLAGLVFWKCTPRPQEKSTTIFACCLISCTP